MITCDRGGRRLAFVGYMYGTGRALPIHPSLFPPLPQFLLRLGVMAPSRNYWAAEKGKALRVGPASPPPKRGRGRPRKHPVAAPVVSDGHGDGSRRGGGRAAVAGGHVWAHAPPGRASALRRCCRSSSFGRRSLLAPGSNSLASSSANSRPELQGASGSRRKAAAAGPRGPHWRSPPAGPWL